MQDQYSIFRKFRSIEEAMDIKALLASNDINCIIDDNVPTVDITFAGSTLNNQVEIRIKQNDFDNAESVLEQYSKTLISDVDKDYYLFEFTNDELYEVLLKSDEWSSFDYTLAQHILSERGKPIDKDLLSSLKKQRLAHLAKPEGNQKPWIIGGYFFSIIGGFIGLIIGYFLWTAKKTLPNGQKVYSYSAKDRTHGKYIFYIGLIFFPLILLWRILYQSY